MNETITWRNPSTRKVEQVRRVSALGRAILAKDKKRIAYLLKQAEISNIISDKYAQRDALYNAAASAGRSIHWSNRYLYL